MIEKPKHNPTTKSRLRELAETFEKANKDEDIDEKEMQEIEALSTKILNVLDMSKSIEEQKRTQDIFINTLKEVAKEQKISIVDFSYLLFGEDVEFLIDDDFVSAAAHVLDSKSKTHPILKRLVLERLQQKDELLAIQFTEGIAPRRKKLREKLTSMNINWPKALQEFEKETGISLDCMGVHRYDEEHPNYEFVLVNTFEGKQLFPVKIILLPKEIQEAKTANELLQILKKKYKALRLQFKANYAFWESKDSVPLQRNSLMGMFAIAPGSLHGVERSFSCLMSMYHKEYGMDIHKILVENPEKWKETGTTGAGNVPEAQPISKQNIIDGLKSGLIEALKKKKKEFLFHYIMHGASDGTFTPKKGESMSAEELGQALSVVDPKSGKPLCSLIRITIVAESCYSGSLLTKVIDYLKKNNIPVKFLTIVTTSSKETASHAGTNILNASLKSDLMYGYEAGTSTYYMAYYFEHLDYLRQKQALAKGIKPEDVQFTPPLGTFSHAMHFADLMAHTETTTKQDLQGYHYSTEEKIDGYFSSIESVEKGLTS